MSAATITAGAVAILAAVSGVYNVETEEENSFDAEDAPADRIYGGRVHFWTVKHEEVAPEMGIGHVELRGRMLVEGFLGVARDAPEDGTASDVTAVALGRAVMTAFSSANNRTIGGTALDAWEYVPQPMVTVTKKVGREEFVCHRLALSFLTAEDA